MILIEIKIVNEETGEVTYPIIKTYEGSYGYEVERFFTQLGEKYARIVEPRYDSY